MKPVQKNNLLKTIAIAKENNSSGTEQPTVEAITESLDNSPIWPAVAADIKKDVEKKITLKEKRDRKKS